MESVGWIGRRDRVGRGENSHRKRVGLSGEGG